MLKKIVGLLEVRADIRQSFKSWKYRSKGVMEGYAPHILDAAEMIDEIWASTDAESLARCWVKAAVLAPPQPA